ncbi:DUF6069 family protein [Streptomyces sp. INA 01156]
MWLVADPLLGHRLRIADGEQMLDIGAVPVVVAALLASLAGWGLLAALERFGRGAPAPSGPGWPAPYWPCPSCRSSATAWTAAPGRAGSDAPGGGGGADPGLGGRPPGRSRRRQGVTANTRHAANSTRGRQPRRGVARPGGPSECPPRAR